MLWRPARSWDQSSPDGHDPDGGGRKDRRTVAQICRDDRRVLVTLDAYTENTKYNSSGFMAALTVPEGASAVLLNENGEQVGDFANGPVTVENRILAPARICISFS